jgi:hypothetical protein
VGVARRRAGDRGARRRGCRLRAVNDALLDAITADDTWALVMLTHTLR